MCSPKFSRFQTYLGKEKRKKEKRMEGKIRQNKNLNKKEEMCKNEWNKNERAIKRQIKKNK